MELYFLIAKFVDPFRRLLVSFPLAVTVSVALVIAGVAVWSAATCWLRTRTAGRIVWGAVLLVAALFSYWELSFASRMGGSAIGSLWNLATSVAAFGTVFVAVVWGTQALLRRTDEQIAEAEERRAARRASGDAPDWGRLVAFYAPALVIGGMIVIPLLALLAASAGIGGSQFERAMDGMTIDRFIFGSAVMIPAIVAFGTDLRFKLTHFVIAFVFVMFLSLQAANRGALIEMQGGPTPMPAYVMLIEALLGLPLTYALGHMGLRIRRLFQRD